MVISRWQKSPQATLAKKKLDWKSSKQFNYEYTKSIDEIILYKSYITFLNWFQF